MPKIPKMANQQQIAASTRKIQLNRPQEQKFKNNAITTGKYNVLTFLPKFLYEQFRKYANIFFLSIGLLQQIEGISPTGKYVTIVPLLVILTITAIKEMVEDFARHREDRKINDSKVDVLKDRTWTALSWKDVCVGDIVTIKSEKSFPADLILLSSSDAECQCYIETANLDGETNLKIRTAHVGTKHLKDVNGLASLEGELEAELPNKNLYDFSGNLTRKGQETQPIGPDEVLLRGSKLRNTTWVYGLVVYTGAESKLMMNSTKAPLKSSRVEKVTNYQIVFLFLILVVISLISSGANSLQYGKLKEGKEPWYMAALGTRDNEENSNNFFLNFLTFFILYNNLIPISLLVSLELVRVAQARFINWDEKMHYVDKEMDIDTYAVAKTSNLNEELGQIKYIFSDKTGTLTRNIMEFKKCSVAGKVYDTEDKDRDRVDNGGLGDELDRSPQVLPANPLAEDLHTRGAGHKQGVAVNPAVTRVVSSYPAGEGEEEEMMREFLTLMAVCHTVVPETAEDGSVRFNAASPDEKALVEGVEVFGYKFIGKTSNSISIKTSSDKTEKYEVLALIDFTSARKRMSVLVRAPGGKLKLYIKGADNVILERVGQGTEQKRYCRRTQEHLDTFARDGLRTLCLGVKEVREEEYTTWAKKWREATTTLVDREEAIEAAAQLIEKDFTLIGATAIEDKLQENVPETIEKLLLADIHVWMLTGDKQITAENIAKSCRLHKDTSELLDLSDDEPTTTVTKIKEKLKELVEKGLEGKDNEITLIIDGKSLVNALEEDIRTEFIRLCTSCKAVICCRVSPLQKAEMVELVSNYTKAITLAIGDGANDVAMIQKASVGVGVSGNEGLQAVNSADFSIGQFSYLLRLLLVHGAWNYARISNVILYSFYKNITLYIVELWFAIYSYWSGQVIYERWSIGMYNVFFTFFPPLALGIFDKTCSDETREAIPQLYTISQRSELYNIKRFWMWIGNAIYHSILLFWLCKWAMEVGVEWGSGNSDGYLVLGNTVYTMVVITTCCKAALIMDSWNYISHIFIWGSVAIWFLFLIVYSHFWPTMKFVASNMPRLYQLMFSSWVFWFLLLLVPATTLLLDGTFAYLKFNYRPSPTDSERRKPQAFKSLQEDRESACQIPLQVQAQRVVVDRQGARTRTELTPVRRSLHVESSEPAETVLPLLASGHISPASLARAQFFSQTDNTDVTS